MVFQNIVLISKGKWILQSNQGGNCIFTYSPVTREQISQWQDFWLIIWRKCNRLYLSGDLSNYIPTPPLTLYQTCTKLYNYMTFSPQFNVLNHTFTLTMSALLQSTWTAMYKPFKKKKDKQKYASSFILVIILLKNYQSARKIKSVPTKAVEAELCDLWRRWRRSLWRLLCLRWRLWWREDDLLSWRRLSS